MIGPLPLSRRVRSVMKRVGIVVGKLITNGRQTLTGTCLMRPLDQVLDSLMNQIPESFVAAQDLTEDLTRVKESYKHAAREMHKFWWSQAAESLNHYLRTPDCEWKNKIDSIFSGKEDYQKYL